MADDLHIVINYGVRLYFKLLYLEKGTRQFGQYSVLKNNIEWNVDNSNGLGLKKNHDIENSTYREPL